MWFIIFKINELYRFKFKETHLKIDFSLNKAFYIPKELELNWFNTVTLITTKFANLTKAFNDTQRDSILQSNLVELNMHMIMTEYEVEMLADMLKVRILC